MFSSCFFCSLIAGWGNQSEDPDLTMLGILAPQFRKYTLADCYEGERHR